MFALQKPRKNGFTAPLTGDHLQLTYLGTADFIDDELAGHEADVVCLCAIGRRYRPNYVRDVVRLLKPRWIIPCHWDTMLTPIHAVPDLIPGVDLPGFVDEIRAAGVTPLLTPLLGQQAFPCCHPSCEAWETPERILPRGAHNEVALQSRSVTARHLDGCAAHAMTPWAALGTAQPSSVARAMISFMISEVPARMRCTRSSS